jgi:hypothetical protein
MADYLALLRQIAPAAEDGARTYLAAARLALWPRAEHGRAAPRDVARTPAIRSLMGLIRAAHTKDPCGRARQRLFDPGPLRAGRITR